MVTRNGNPIPALVAHRGYARRYPENTIESVKAALEAGATHLEVDVHLTADGIPVLHHDADLVRTAGDSRRVDELPLRELTRVEVAETRRFGPAFTGTRIPTLAAVVELLAQWPDAFLFVEIKPSALRRLGRGPTVDRVLAALAPVRARSSVISFDVATIELARRNGSSVGWILERWDAEAQRAAERLGPEFLFCDHEKIPPCETLWPGPWRWAVYEVGDAALALCLAAQGAAFVETMAIGELLADPRLRGGRGPHGGS